MNERLKYRLHTIDLELMEIRPQRFRWLYMIDSTHFKAGTDVLQPEAVARTNALVAAHSQIDTLELIATTTKQFAPIRLNGNAPTIPSALLRGGGERPVDRSEEARRRVALRRPDGVESP